MIIKPRDNSIQFHERANHGGIDEKSLEKDCCLLRENRGCIDRVELVGPVINCDEATGEENPEIPWIQKETLLKSKDTIIVSKEGSQFYYFDEDKSEFVKKSVKSLFDGELE